jgi:hypothetical protein
MRRMAHDDLLRRGCGLAQALILAFERLRSILLVETEKSSWTLVQRCPLWVKSRHMRCNKPCLLYTRKRHWMRSFRRPLRANRGHSASGGRNAGNRIGHEAVGCARPAGRAGARTTSGTLHAPFDVGAALSGHVVCGRDRPRTTQYCGSYVSLTIFEKLLVAASFSFAAWPSRRNGLPWPTSSG